MASKLPIALSHAKRGFAVFPVQPMAKAPPLLADWPNKATRDPAEIEVLWAAVPDANVALHCVGMIVLDIDTAKGGDTSLEVLQDLYACPATLTTRTPSGGRHLFYALPIEHPGVANTVGKLGPGIDVRSTGGYVLSPGSDTEAGRYHFEADLPIAPAPEWLLKLLGTATVRQERPAASVPDAPLPALQRAQEWLSSHAGAVEGQGGDLYTYQTACRLRDFGVSEQQAVELLVSWNTTCSPPWDVSDIRQKAHNAYRYSQEAEPGKLSVTAEDFPIVPNLSTIVPNLGTVGDTSTAPVAKTRVLRLVEFANSESRSHGYLVKGLLQRGSYAEIYGAPGEGKTFVALDLAYAVAAGKPWMDKNVHTGLALYLAYEGAGGLVNRAKALRQHYGDKDVSLYITGAAFNLRDLVGRAALGELIATLPEKPALIVFDTLAHALCGGDENSAQDVSAFNSAVQALIASTGAAVIIIHHSGKDKSKGARGSSALLAALDTEIEIDNHAITPTKQRDVELGQPIGFKLAPLVVGIDEDGDEITSCVVVPGAPPAPERQRITGNNKRCFDVLCDMAPDNAPVTTEEWREACEEFMGQGKTLVKRFWSIKEELKERGYILIDTKDKITRSLE